MGQGLGALNFANLGLVHTTHVTTHNQSKFQGSDTLFWLPQTPGMQANTHECKTKNF